MSSAATAGAENTRGEQANFLGELRVEQTIGNGESETSVLLIEFRNVERTL